MLHNAVKLDPIRHVYELVSGGGRSILLKIKDGAAVETTGGSVWAHSCKHKSHIPASDLPFKAHAK